MNGPFSKKLLNFLVLACLGNFLLWVPYVLAGEADEAAWERAKKADTPEAYLGFMLNYPDSEYADEANKRFGGAHHQARKAILEAPVVLEELYNNYGAVVWDKAEREGTRDLYYYYCTRFPYGEYYKQASERLAGFEESEFNKENRDMREFMRGVVLRQGQLLKEGCKSFGSEKDSESRYSKIQDWLIENSNSHEDSEKTKMELVFASWCEAEPVFNNPKIPASYGVEITGIADGQGGYSEISSLTFDVHLIQKGGDSPFPPIYIHASLSEPLGYEKPFATVDASGKIRLNLDDKAPIVFGYFNPTGAKPEPDFLSMKIDGFVLAPDRGLIGSYFYASSNDNEWTDIASWKSKTELPEGVKWYPKADSDVLLLEIVDYDSKLHLKVLQ